MSGLSEVLRKTAFKLIFIGDIYFDTSKCRLQETNVAFVVPVTVIGRLSFFVPLFLGTLRDEKRCNGGNMHGGGIVEKRDRGPSCCDQL